LIGECWKEVEEFTRIYQSDEGLLGSSNGFGGEGESERVRERRQRMYRTQSAPVPECQGETAHVVSAVVTRDERQRL
jgi:hypothetical protein